METKNSKRIKNKCEIKKEDRNPLTQKHIKKNVFSKADTNKHTYIYILLLTYTPLPMHPSIYASCNLI